MLRLAIGILFTLALSLTFPHIEGRPPSRTCRICEDVAQTYHDRYACAGNDIDMWGASDNPLIPACETPIFQCEKLTGDIKEACQAMEFEFVDNYDQARLLWMSQMEFGQHYDTCVKLGKCESDPNPEEKEYSSCHQVFQTEHAKYDILDPAFTSNCTEECYLCNWLVKEWPLFQEICTPDGTQMANSIDPDRDVQKLSGLEGIQKLEQAKSEQEAEFEALEAEAGQEQAATAEGESEEASAGEGEGEGEVAQEEEASFMQQRQQHFVRHPIARPSPSTYPHHRSASHFMRSTPSTRRSDAQLISSVLKRSRADSVRSQASFLESSAQVKANSMSRTWSKATHRAIHGVLQSQSSNPLNFVQSDYTGDFSADGAEIAPVIDGSDLKKDCFAMWRYFARSRKAKFFASWKRTIGIEITPADIERSNGWDANIACKCLGQCGLDAFEHLGLIKQCRYDDRDRVMMEYAFQTPH